MTPEELDAIRERAEKATPGPWEADEPFVVDDEGTMATWLNGPAWWYDGYFESSADADFIAHAREDIPALLAEVERLREENERLRQANPLTFVDRGPYIHPELEDDDEPLLREDGPRKVVVDWRAINRESAT